MADIPATRGTDAGFAAALGCLPVGPDILRQGGTLLAALSRPPAGAAPDTVRAWSLLTPNGCPLEIAFGAPAEELRLTTEVGGVGLAPLARLALAARRLDALTLSVPQDGLAWCAEMQGGATLRWGAWVSLRVGPGGPPRGKLYAEVPVARHGEAVARVTAPLRFLDRLSGLGARLTMVGLPAGQPREFYFGLRGLRYGDLPGLFDPVGTTGDGLRVLAALEAVCGRYLNRAAANRQSGLSCQRRADGSLRLTLFCQAGDLFRSDSETRRALLRAAPHLGVDLTAYAAFTRPLAENLRRNTHCMVALTPLPGGGVDLRVGASPPWPAPG